MGFAVQSASKKKSKSNTFPRMYFLSKEDSNDFRADRIRSESNDERVQLYYRDGRGNWQPDLILQDHGNGIWIEGDGVSLNLDYGKWGDILLLLQAHDKMTSSYGVFTKYHESHCTVTRKKRKSRKGK